MSAEFPTFINGLSVLSALALTLRVVSTLLVLLLAPGLTMRTRAYLQSLPTTSIDYSEFKTASPASFNPITLLFRHARNLLPFTDFQFLNETCVKLEINKNKQDYRTPELPQSQT